MNSAPDSAQNRITPLRFVLVFGLVSGLGDVVYEGARSIIGPFLATFGASAALVGVITGTGEAVALVFRLFTGQLSDRTGRHWAISITGYAITMVSVPLLAVAGPLWLACTFIVGERFGKAVRTPARSPCSRSVISAAWPRYPRPSIRACRRHRRNPWASADSVASTGSTRHSPH